MEQLNDIIEVSELKKRVEAIELKVMKPQLANTQEIPMLYDWYKNIASEITGFYEKDSTEYRQVFLYCILMLYCPRSFAEQFLIKGLRQQLAILLDISPSHISNMIKNISFYYKKYTKFKNYCDMAMAEIQFKLDLTQR